MDFLLEKNEVLIEIISIFLLLKFILYFFFRKEGGNFLPFIGFSFFLCLSSFIPNTWLVDLEKDALSTLICFPICFYLLKCVSSLVYSDVKKENQNTKWVEKIRKKESREALDFCLFFISTIFTIFFCGYFCFIESVLPYCRFFRLLCFLIILLFIFYGTPQKSLRKIIPFLLWITIRFLISFFEVLEDCPFFIENLEKASTFFEGLKVMRLVEILFLIIIIITKRKKGGSYAF